MTNETAPERIFAVIGYRGYDYTGTVHVTTGEFHTVKGALYGKNIEYVPKAELEAAQARIAELEQHIADMIDDSGQECACGYDNPTDICLGHLPMYRKTQARIAELERQLGGGCDANNGGEHTVMSQGKYKYCGKCGESLRGVRYCHEPRAALEGKG